MKAPWSVLSITAMCVTLVACGGTKNVSRAPETSNAVQVTFSNSTTSDVLARLAKKCSQIGSAVKEIKSDSITCVRRLSDTDAALVDISSDTTRLSKPENRIKFTAQPDGRDVIVTTQQWAEIPNVPGQSTRVDLNHAKQKDNLRKIMVSMGGTM